MFQVIIRTSNAAFQDGRKKEEVARILKEIATDIEQGVRENKVKDINGNTVGRWVLE